MTAPAFRVGVVGARRVRGGTGEHLARFLHASGVKVVAVLGTSPASAAEAAAGLAARHGITATPYVDLERLLAEARLDALVVASPDATHRTYLERALEAGLHVLCEKPLVHGGSDAVAAGERLLDAFAARGLCLAVNAQWRYALPAYLRLHPDVNPRAARSFRMELSPVALGPDAVPVGRSICVVSPVMTIVEPKPRRVRNIFICSGEVFCASSRMMNASLSVRPRR